MGVFDVIFARLKDPATRPILESWLERDQCRWQESEPAAPGTAEAGRKA